MRVKKGYSRLSKKNFFFHFLENWETRKKKSRKPEYCKIVWNFAHTKSRSGGIFWNDIKLFKAEVKLGIVDFNGKPKKLPIELKEKLEHLWNNSVKISN